MANSSVVLLSCFQVEQITAELNAERSSSQKLETEKSQLDRQNKELRAKLTEIETEMKIRSKAALQAMESKIANLEEQLDIEIRWELLGQWC